MFLRDCACFRALTKALEDTKDTLKGDDLETIKSSNEKLQEAVQAAAGEAYKATTEEEQTGGETKADDGEETPEKKDSGPVVEAEVVEEEKK